MRRGSMVLRAFVGLSALALAACDSDDSSLVTANDGGLTFGDAALGTFDASAIDSASASPDAATEASAPDAGDAAVQPLVLTSSSTQVTAEGTVTLTATVVGGTATSIEIDDGANAIATLAAAPYQKTISLSFADNGTHSYTAKATLAGGQVLTSAAVVVTIDIAAHGFFVDPANGLDTNAGT